ncbi:hypothetical protein BFS06_11530 [Clostridium perfringens]|nr:hypothetical protein BFS06_11530 [Clostridium perfringens]
MKIKNKYLLALGLIMPTFFVGCSNKNIDSSLVKKDSPLMLVNVLNLEKDNVSTEDLKKYDSVVENLFSGLNDEKTINKLVGEVNNNSIKELFGQYMSSINVISPTFKTTLVDNTSNVILDTYRKAIQNVGDKLWSMNVVGAGYKADSSGIYKEIIVDMNFVSDNPGFKIQTFKMLLDENNNIVSIQKDGELNTQANTRNPLSNEPYLSGDLNSNFKTSLNTILKKLLNKTVYDNYNDNPNDISNVKNLVSSIKIEKHNEDVLIELFKDINSSSKGKYGVTYIMNTNINANAETSYVLSIQSGNNIKKYSFNYNRITDKITTITNLS